MIFVCQYIVHLLTLKKGWEEPSVPPNIFLIQWQTEILTHSYTHKNQRTNSGGSRFTPPVNEPLLQNRQQVIYQPVQDKSGGEVKEHKCENQGHEHKDLGLIGIHGGRAHLLLEKHGGPHNNRGNVIRVFGRQILDPENKRCVPQLYGS
jgi:hypothetical protein